MRQIATAQDGTGYEVAGDAGSAELYEDGVMVVSVATFKEARTIAKNRLLSRLESEDPHGLIRSVLEWRTEHD